MSNKKDVVDATINNVSDAPSIESTISRANARSFTSTNGATVQESKTFLARFNDYKLVKATESILEKDMMVLTFSEPGETPVQVVTAPKFWISNSFPKGSLVVVTTLAHSRGDIFTDVTGAKTIAKSDGISLKAILPCDVMDFYAKVDESILLMPESLRDRAFARADLMLQADLARSVAPKAPTTEEPVI